MFEEREKKRSVKSLVVQIVEVLIIVSILSVFTTGIRARFFDTETCGYSACNDVVSNADASKAQALNCQCQCESTHTLTEECRRAYSCETNGACWKLAEKQGF